MYMLKTITIIIVALHLGEHSVTIHFDFIERLLTISLIFVFPLIQQNQVCDQKTIKSQVLTPFIQRPF